MSSSSFIYGSILRFGTLQFDGHVHDYFVQHTSRLVEFYILARGGKEKNFVSVYERGKLKEKQVLFSPRNIVVAYITFYVQYVSFLFRYFGKHEKVFIINSLPVFFFFNSVWRVFRNYGIVYWVQDYWPMNDLRIRVFRRIMHFYHSRMKYAVYVSDRINKVMNGKIINTPHKHTVMLGMDQPTIRTIGKHQPFTLTFIGVLKDSQGIDEILKAVASKKDLRLKLIGTGNSGVIANIKEYIKKQQIEQQVFFPNQFYYGEELKQIIADCHVGVVLYDRDPNSVTYYADPAKIKQYAEFGLPIITTNTAETAGYITRFQAGIIVEQHEEELLAAVKKIQRDYKTYSYGVRDFCKYFSYESYFRNRFMFLADRAG